MNTRVKAVARALRDRRVILLKDGEGDWKPSALSRSALLKHVRSLATLDYCVSIRRLSDQDRGLIEYITKEERHAEEKERSIHFDFCDALRWFDELTYPSEVKALLIKHFIS
jgi:hypothetical protein